jgi:hypothetical protein
MIQPEIFDILGLVGFIILFCIGLRIIREKKLKYYGYAILLISLIGIIADGYIIINKFILGN